MSVPLRHALEQGAVVRAMLGSALAALGKRPSVAPSTPTPALVATVAAPSRQLVADYVRWAGGRPASYDGRLPPELYPQWGVPLLSQTLADVPYDLRRVLNGGTRLEINAPLPRDEPLELEASLEAVEERGGRAHLRQRLITGTASAPAALVATVSLIVPLGQRDGSSKPSRPRPRVPLTARPLARRRLAPTAGRDFALLTGDVNPIHWLGPAARAAGFPRPILQGYATLALAVETLVRVLFAGDPGRLRMVDVRFVRPLPLPHDISVFIDTTRDPDDGDDDGDDGLASIYVGENPGGPAFMTGVYDHG